MKRLNKDNKEALSDLLWGLAVVAVNLAGFILSVRIITMIPIESVDAGKFIGFVLAITCAMCILYGIALIIHAVRNYYYD